MNLRSLLFDLHLFTFFRKVREICNSKFPDHNCLLKLQIISKNKGSITTTKSLLEYLKLKFDRDFSIHGVLAMDFHLILVSFLIKFLKEKLITGLKPVDFYFIKVYKTKLPTNLDACWSKVSKMLREHFTQNTITRAKFMLLDQDSKIFSLYYKPKC